MSAWKNYTTALVEAYDVGYNQPKTKYMERVGSEQQWQGK